MERDRSRPRVFMARGLSFLRTNPNANASSHEVGPSADTAAHRPFAARSMKPTSRRCVLDADAGAIRSEEHTSELQSLMRISYAVFCMKNKKQYNPDNIIKSNPQTN